METKACTHCGITRSADQFYTIRVRNRKTGRVVREVLSSWCKPCNNIRRQRERQKAGMRPQKRFCREPHSTPITEFTRRKKQCSRCGQWRAAQAFNKDRQRADGSWRYKNICRACENVRHKEYYEAAKRDEHKANWGGLDEWAVKATARTILSKPQIGLTKEQVIKHFQRGESIGGTRG